MGDSILVNGKTVTAKKNLDCKSDNVLYVAQCKICNELQESTYGGQTGQPFHKRTNGHRACFKIEDEDAIEKSALALHSKIEHSDDDFTIENFKFVLYDQCRPRDLNRRESRLIGELRTNVLGLNRMNVQK